MEEERDLLLKAAQLEAERSKEEINRLVLRVANAEIREKRAMEVAEKMNGRLDDAAELMRRYDALLGRLSELNKKMREWLRH